MCSAVARGKKVKFLVSELCHPQTIAVCQSRADGLGLQLVVGDHKTFDYRHVPACSQSLDHSHHHPPPPLSGNDVCGVLVQYPATDGAVIDYTAFVDKAHAGGAKVVVATDLLALTLLKPPGEYGADICIGSAQRFGVPMGFGGPHAGFLATSDVYKRLMPGRIIGVSIDAQGEPALRMAMQTREQHIRRDKATSNICTAQALLANMAAMYAVYHGPAGLTAIAQRVHGLAGVLSVGAARLGCTVAAAPFFDTVRLTVPGQAKAMVAAAAKAGCNLRLLDSDTVTIAVDETTSLADVDQLFKVLSMGKPVPFTAESLAASAPAVPPQFARTSPFLTHPVFNSYHTEHEMLRYLARLEAKDLSLVHSIIALGSCTMKLNATSEMIPITWNEFANLHPFAPADQTQGYTTMFKELSEMLCEITGFDAMSLQPNSGASGEYTGLMAIRAYHHSRGDQHRNVCLIPASAHGTNPASASMASMQIVVIRTRMPPCFCPPASDFPRPLHQPRTRTATWTCVR